MLNNFVPKAVSFVSYVEKYGTTRQATHANTLLRTNAAICMPDN